MASPTQIVERRGGDLSIDQRRYRRLQTLLSACLVDGSTRHDCAILDLSVSGARLQFDRPPEVIAGPGNSEASDNSGHKVRLRLTSKLSFAGLTELPIKVIWQDEARVGVRFAAEPESIVQALESLLPPEFLSS